MTSDAGWPEILRLKQPPGGRITGGSKRERKDVSRGTSDICQIGLSVSPEANAPQIRADASTNFA